MCHNNTDGCCENDATGDWCKRGWHITEKKYKEKKRKRRPQPPDKEPKTKHRKRDAKLEIYLSRFGYTPKDMPDRKQIEAAFMNATEPWQTDSPDLEERFQPQFTYEEYSDAFQYILDSIENDKLEMYLSRFGFTREDMPDRRQIEEAFMNATEPWQADSPDLEELSASQFTYEEYSEAFQYILETIAE